MPEATAPLSPTPFVPRPISAFGAIVAAALVINANWASFAAN